MAQSRSNFGRFAARHSSGEPYPSVTASSRETWEKAHRVTETVRTTQTARLFPSQTTLYCPASGSGCPPAAKQGAGYDSPQIRPLRTIRAAVSPPPGRFWKIHL